MNGKGNILDYVQLSWFVHMHRMEEHRLPKKVMIWNAPNRRRRSRPRHAWLDEITQPMTNELYIYWGFFYNTVSISHSKEILLRLNFLSVASSIVSSCWWWFFLLHNALFPRCPFSPRTLGFPHKYHFWNSDTFHPLETPKPSHSYLFCYLIMFYWTFINCIVFGFLIFSFLYFLYALRQKSFSVANNLFAWCLPNFQGSGTYNMILNQWFKYQ